MKKKLLAIAIVQLIVIQIYSQSVNWAFGGGQHTDDNIAETAIDDEGNIYITGFASFGAQIGTYVLSNWGIYVAKLDKSGNLIWVIESDGNSDTQSTGITVDPEGGVCITGYYSHHFSFGDSYLQGVIQPRMFIVKISESGNVLWVKDFGTNSISESTYANSISSDSQGNIYVAGGFESIINFDNIQLESKKGYYGYDFDVFIVKLDREGNALWAKRGGSNSEDYAYDIVIDNNDNIYISGVFRPYEADFGNSIINYTNITLCGFVAKYNTNGNIEWVHAGKQVSNSYSESTNLAVDNSGFVYSLGSLYGTLIFNEDTLKSNNYDRNNYIVRYTSDGQVIDTKLFNNSVNPNRYVNGTYGRKIGDIAIGKDNSLYVSSSYLGDLENDDFSLYNTGNNDIFIAKYNDLGYFKWVKNISGDGSEIVRTITVNDDIILGGNYSSLSLRFNKDSITNYSGNGDDDFFIVSISDTTINTPLNSEDIKIYPNPNRGKFYVKLDKLSSNKVDLYLYDFSGKKIYQQNYNVTTNYFWEEIQTQDLRGIYILVLNTNGTIYSQKVIIQQE